MRALLFSLLAVLVGCAMVGGGIWGLVDSSGGDSSSASTQTPEIKTSSPAECAQVAERDPRFRIPHDLLFGADGRAAVQCNGSSVTFAIQLDGLEQGTFYEVVLERGRRTEVLGTILAVDIKDVDTVTVGPEVRLRRYDFLTVRVDEFHNPGVDQAPFRAAL